MKETIMTRHILFFIILILPLGGCVTESQNHSSALPERHSLPELHNQKLQAEEGSIFSPHAMDLYADRRAHKVGDILLVEIVETSNAAKEANTETKRSSSIAGDIGYLFRFADWFKLRENTPGAKTVEATLSNNFKGEGDTDQKSTVTATLSARVIDITMDGNLVIQGYRQIRINNDTQHIILSGLVRPDDISPENSIKSSYIADARIEMNGEGVIADKQQPGWMARGVDMLWPF
jgi:flagellar L-ring protein precursor FlgH